MKLKSTLAVMMLLLTMGLWSAAAHADTVTFTLSDPTQSIGLPGTLTYDATISAPITNGAVIDLNGDSFNVDSPLVLDDTDFLNTFFFLNPGESITSPLFTITVPVGVLPGTYDGSFTLLGGATGSSMDDLGTVTFSATVTPEPSSLILLGTGITGALTMLNKRRRSNQV